MTGGVLAMLGAMTPAERAKGRYMRAPDGHEGGDTGGGDDPRDPAEVADGGAGGGSGDAAGAGDAPGSDAGGDAPGGEGSPWWGDQLSSDPPDHKTMADAQWMANKGFGDLQSVVKGYRALEARRSETVAVPGEDATDEHKAAYRKAIGVPDDAAGYEAVSLIPDGWEADLSMIEPLAQAAHEAGISKAGFEAIVKPYVERVVEDHHALVAAQDNERASVFQEWGAQKDQNVMLMKSGFEAFGLSADDVQAMQTALADGGTKKMMALGLKLGQLSGEDGFVSGAPKSFGIAPEAARAELERLENDREFYNKLKSGDATAKARHERLLAVIAADDERKARAAAAIS